MHQANRLLVASSIVLFAAFVASCGGRTPLDAPDRGDASADSAPTQAMLDATTDSFEPMGEAASADTIAGDHSSLVDSSIDTESDSAIGDGSSEAADAHICVPATCATFGFGLDCGYAADGCGGLLLCGGPCTAPEFCGGGGFDLCGGCNGIGCWCFACQPRTCSQQNIACGPASDGCGNELDCGTCPGPQTCGGGGVPGQCGNLDGGACAPVTCVQQNITCGPAGDGCGSELMCGTCAAPMTCGGGGVHGQCGAPDAGVCVGVTCAGQNINCGPAGDGYGGLLQCGTCTPPQTCGGGGFGRCG